MKYSIIFTLLISLSLNTLVFSDEKTSDININQLNKITEIKKKHNIDFEKKFELKSTVYGCLIENPTKEKKELGYTNAYKLLNYYDELISNVGINDQLKKDILDVVSLLSWCIKEKPEKHPKFIELVRRMIDTDIINSNSLYGDEEVIFSGGLMNYSIYSEDLNLNIDDRWIYDEKIIKILIQNLPKSFNDLSNFIYFSLKDFKKEKVRPKLIKMLKPQVKSLKYENFESDNEKKNFVSFSGSYLNLLIQNKNFTACNSFIDNKLKNIKFNYKEISRELNIIDFKLNCLMAELKWDKAIEAYKNKADKITNAFENFKYDKYKEEELKKQLFSTYNALVATYRIISHTEQDDKMLELYLNKATNIVDDYFYKNNKYYYLLLSVDLIEHEIYNNNINKAEKKLTKHLEEVENLTENDGYPFESGFEDQIEDLKADYFSLLSQIFVKTKRYKEAISINKKIIKATEKILTRHRKTLDITKQFNIEAFKYKLAHIDLFLIYNLLQDRENQSKYHNITSKFCDNNFNDSVCLSYYPAKLDYALHIKDPELIDLSYKQLKTYYSQFQTDNKYIKYMTDTDLIEQKIYINLLKINHRDEFKLNEIQVTELRKEACNDTDNLEKRLFKINKQIGKEIKNQFARDVYTYQSTGIHFIKVGLECKSSKSDYKKAIKILQEVLDLEKKKLDQWVNIPTYYQYDIDTNLISKIGFAAEGYKELSGIKKRTPEGEKLIKDVFQLSQYGKNLYITNSIKNSLTKTINSNLNFKNLINKKVSLQTKLNILMDEIINNKSSSKDKFKQKNSIESEIQNINEKINNDFPAIKKKLNKKFYTVDDVQSKLSLNELLIVFDSHLSPFAHIISKNSHDTFFSNVPIRDLHNFSFLFRNEIFKKDSKELKSSLKIFYKALFDQIESKIKKNSKITIITDQYTENLPFGIFYNEKNNKYLIEEYSISYLPSVGSFVELRNDKSIKYINYDNAFLGIGDPLLQEKKLKDFIFSISNLSLNTRGILDDTNIIKEKFKNLPYSEYELKKIGKIFKKKKLLLSDQANEANVKNINLENYDIISFATHAGISGSLNESSEPFLVLTPPEKSSLINDGILTASEVSQLNLNAKLVILSACNTAAKENEYASGFSGLVASFFNAGAQSILATHWNVDDKTTATMIIETIKKSVNQNINLSDALKLTKIEFISGKHGEKYKHPKYWGAYVIVGN